MKLTRKAITLAGATLALMLVIACAGAVPANPGAATPVRAPTPAPATDMIEGPAPIDLVDIWLTEGSDSPAQLIVVSGLPNGCTRYKDNVVSQEANAITSTVTNLVPADPNISCIQVYGTNQSHTDLSGEFDPCNTYTVVVNGSKYAVQPKLRQLAGTGVSQVVEVADPSTLCADPQKPAPTGDRDHVQAPIEDVQIIVAESFPLQYFVAITVGLPNACYDFGEASVERDDSVVRINVTNLAPADPTQMCAEIYRTVVENVALGSDFDPNVAYTLEVNGTSYQLTEGGSGGALPQPIDPGVKEVPAPIESVQINIANRQTEDATLTVVSGLPSGCAKLARFETSQRGDLIVVAVLNSIPVGANIICTAIYGFEQNEANLTGSYTACETYIVEINGESRPVQAIEPAVRCRAPEVPTTSQDREQVPAPIENVRILATKSLPPQYTAVITVGLPNACYDLDGHEVTMDGTTVRISVTNLAPADPNAMCAEIYRTTDISVSLGSDFKPGIEYTVDVNGKTTPLTPGFSEPSRPSSGYDARYGSPFTLTEGGTVSVGNEFLVIKLDSIKDSRCPANVVCIWMGEAAIVVSASHEGESLGQREIILEPRQSAPGSADLGGFLITFVSLEPYPGTEGQTPSQPTTTLIVQPTGAHGIETGQDKATVKLSVRLVDGSPLTIRLVADIVGGEDNDKRLYCQGVTWSFGDGNQIAVMPGCQIWTPDSSFMRHWEETYTYANPGTYQVSSTYGPLPTATAQVTVK